MNLQVPLRADLTVKAMASIATSNVHILILFVWIVSVLTSPVNTEVKTDGVSSASAASLSSNNTTSNKEQQSLASVAGFASKAVGSTTTFGKNESSPSFLGEGGPISILPTVQAVSSTASPIPSISSNLHAAGDVSVKLDNDPIKKNSSQPRISPRKGANPDSLDRKKISLPLSNITSPIDKTLIIPSVLTKSTLNNEENTGKVNNEETDAIVKHVQQANVLNVANNISLHDTNVSQRISSTMLSTPAIKKHKPKPTVTVGEPGIDKPIPASPTKSSPLGMPRKIDYVIPIIITIVALPLLGAATFMVYRQGRDCWDKRHYRRMDFLIDGMYND